MDDLFRGKASHGKMTMKVVTAWFTRELTLEQWSRGKDQALVRILEPQKERGTATLKSGPDIWSWLPKVQRVVKVSASMMGDAWMGSHFTNDDLVRQTRMADDFTAVVSFEGARAGEVITEFTLTPRAEAAVVWGKLVVEVRADGMPTSIRYYDEELKLGRTLRFTDYQQLGGKRLPARLTVVPEGKPGESTEVLYRDLEFDVALDTDFFSLRTLQK